MQCLNERRQIKWFFIVFCCKMNELVIDVWSLMEWVLFSELRPLLSSLQHCLPCRLPAGHFREALLTEARFTVGRHVSDATPTPAMGPRAWPPSIPKTCPPWITRDAPSSANSPSNLVKGNECSHFYPFQCCRSTILISVWYKLGSV